VATSRRKRGLPPSGSHIGSTRRKRNRHIRRDGPQVGKPPNRGVRLADEHLDIGEVFLEVRGVNRVGVRSGARRFAVPARRVGDPQQGRQESSGPCSPSLAGTAYVGELGVVGFRALLGRVDQKMGRNRDIVIRRR
jgi:hypothetical protein